MPFVPRSRNEFPSLTRSIGMQAVSTLDSTAQSQPPGTCEETSPVPGHFWYPYVIDVLEHHGMPEIGLTSLKVMHASI